MLTEEGMAVQEYYKEWLRPGHYIQRFFCF